MELADSFFLLGIAQLDRTEVALAKKEALMVCSSGHQLVIRRPEVDHLLYDRAVTPVIYVHDA